MSCLSLYELVHVEDSSILPPTSTPSLITTIDEVEEVRAMEQKFMGSNSCQNEKICVCINISESTVE